MDKRLPFVVLILILPGALHADDPATAPVQPRCEYRVDPTGIDAATPRLSWVNRADRQTAYRILVASTPEKLARGEGDRWDSGQVGSDEQNQIVYAGEPLASRARAYWNVRIWDGNDRPSAPSPTASWTMGLLKPEDWHAQWIGAATPLIQPDADDSTPPPKDKSPTQWAVPEYLRKEFTTDHGEIVRATAYVSALGLYELQLNGQRVGDQRLAPEWTNYKKRVQYHAYDVTPLVRSGRNALGAVLANGWYSGGWQHWGPQLAAIYGQEPFLLAQLEIEHADGTVQEVVTDESWHATTDGPRRFAGIYEGETYDATKEMPGWDMPGFGESKWQGVKQAPAGTPIGKLVWQRDQPIRVTQELKPVAVTEPKPGVYVFKFDQNMAGACRFSFRGSPGQKIEMQHAEMVDTEGTVSTANLLVVAPHRIQRDVYTFRGDGVETFTPEFTYHGFQYVEVRGLKKKPPLESVTGLVFHTDCPEVGQFTCSDPLVNRLEQNVLWSQRANYMGVPTDCPQRNERCGYTGDANFFIRSGVFTMDVAAFFNRWLVDVDEDAQLPDGHFADHAPTFGPGDGPNVGWGDGGIICPYEIYRTYGDTRVIREHYAAMKRYTAYLDHNLKNGIFTGRVGNGDWLSNQGGADPQVIGIAYAAFDFGLMAEMAEAIGEEKDAKAFQKRHEKIAADFAETYIDENGDIKGSSQTGYAMAFTMDLVPPSLKDKMASRFHQEMEKFDWHPRSGFIGTPRLLTGLHLAGRDDDAYRSLLTKTLPSWLYPVTVGATTIWENWDGWDGVHPKGGMNSLNHYSFGSINEYLYGVVAGIQPAAPGYKKVRVAPVLGNGLTEASASYDSIRGPITSKWKREGDHVTFDIGIPPNTTATVELPGQPPQEVGPGQHRFKVPLSKQVASSSAPCTPAPIWYDRRL